MFFTKPFLLGLVAASALSAPALKAQAQQPSPYLPNQSSLTTVDANGNMIRARMPDANAIAATSQHGPLSANSIASGSFNDRARRGNGRNDTIRYGTTIYGNPYYPGFPGAYPGFPAVNNYYYPAQPSTTVIFPPAFPNSRPTTITNVPLGGAYGYPAFPAPAYGFPGGYPANGYPSGGYGYGYPAPAYGYPAQTYGYPVYPGYPAYGTTTTIYGNVPGGIYTQSQTSGYGLSIGQGGVSIQLGNRKSSSSTTINR